jgi:hypothetical protein
MFRLILDTPLDEGVERGRAEAGPVDRSARAGVRPASDELLSAVDVVGGAGQCRVDHQVDGERGDVFGPDDPSDRQCRDQLGAAVLELIAKQGR